jgi:hypothetical protein
MVDEFRDQESIADNITDDPNVGGEKKSQLSTVIALDALTIVRDELSKLGCQLKNYYITFNAEGFDIDNIKIQCQDPSRIIEVLKVAEPEVRHEFSKSPTRYAYKAANIEIARRIDAELGLDYKALEFEKSDKVLVSIREPKEEKPLPPSQQGLPPEITQGVIEPFEPDQNADLGIEEPINLPDMANDTQESIPKAIGDFMPDEITPEDEEEEEGIKEPELGEEEEERPGREF